MRARAHLIAGPDPGGGPYRLIRMASAAPVAWRATPDGVYMVGAAASPVADDQVAVDVEVRSGAALVVRSTAATVAWGSRGSCQLVTAKVDPGGALDWRPEPLIATAGCDHRQKATIAMGSGARLLWAEQLVLGRHGEAPGSLQTSLSAAVDGRPLLRHSLEVGPRALAWSSASVLGAARAVGLLLAAGPEAQGTRAHGPGWAVMPLDGPGAVGLAVAGDARELQVVMDRMRAVLSPDDWGRGQGAPRQDALTAT